MRRQTYKQRDDLSQVVEKKRPRMKRNAPIVALALVLGLCALPELAGAEKQADKSGAFYEVDLKTTKGKTESVTTITAKGKGGFHCNTLYPWKLTIEPEAGIVVNQTIYKKKDAKTFSDKAVAFDVKYTPKSGKSISAKLKLSVCDDKQCKMETVSLKW